VAVTGIDALIERGREALTRPDVVRAERSDPSFLRFGKRYRNIAVNPRQSPIAFDGVHLIAFGLSQFHALHNRFTINHRCAAANSPDTAAIFVGREAVTLFLIQKLVKDYGCRSTSQYQP
jgi:hypothetical protein